MPSKPAVPQTRVMRVGSRKNSSSSLDLMAVTQVLPGARKSLKPEARYSAGTMASAPSTRKYFEMIGCSPTARRIDSAISIARITSS